MLFTKTQKILYTIAFIVVLVSIPVGEALKDYGIIHAIGVCVFVFLFVVMTRQLYRQWKLKKKH